MSEPPSYSWSPLEFERLFPFHLVVDAETRIRRLGPSLQRMFPNVDVGQPLSHYFRIKRPNIAIDYARILENCHSLFLLERLGADVMLKGQMFPMDRGNMIVFLCSPWVTDLQQVRDLGISLADFAVHDPVSDYLFLLQAKDTTLAESTKLQKELRAHKETLEEMVEKRTQQLRSEIAERELQREAADRERRFAETIVNSMADGLITIDRSGIVQFYNRAAEKIFGYTVEEVVGNDVTMLMPSPYRDAEHGGHLERYHRTGEAHIIGREREVEGRRKDGSTFPLALRVCEMAVAGGETMYIGMAQDITERKAVEESLRRSEAEYRGLVEQAMYGIYRSTTDGTLLMVNPALVEMLGYDSEAELLALGSAEQLYADPAQRPDKLKEFEEKHEVEVEWKRKDGATLLVRLRGKLVDDSPARGGVFQIMAEDVTERLILEEQLRQAQRLDALGRLAGGVAHDFNNILSIIIIEAQLGLRRVGDDHPVRDCLSGIKAAGERAAALTGQLLAFSRSDMVKPVVLNLNALVADISSMLTRLIAEDIHLTIATEEKLGNVLADRGQVEQILTNLVVNARDAMPNGGDLAIRTAMMMPDQAFLRTRPGLTSNHYAVLEVRDTGTGIAEDVRARMFDPFFTTKADGKGTGLGLATVYGIVQKMEGHIEVATELEVGTMIGIYLPIVDEEETEGRLTEDSLPVLGDETVLVVEDDDPLRHTVIQLLEEQGYTVLSADDGGQALQQLGAYEGEWLSGSARSGQTRKYSTCLATRTTRSSRKSSELATSPSCPSPSPPSPSQRRSVRFWTKSDGFGGVTP